MKMNIISAKRSVDGPDHVGHGFIIILRSNDFMESFQSIRMQRGGLRSQPFHQD